MLSSLIAKQTPKVPAPHLQVAIFSPCLHMGEMTYVSYQAEDVRVPVLSWYKG